MKNKCGELSIMDDFGIVHCDRLSENYHIPEFVAGATGLTIVHNACPLRKNVCVEDLFNKYKTHPSCYSDKQEPDFKKEQKEWVEKNKNAEPKERKLITISKCAGYHLKTQNIEEGQDIVKG